MCKKQKIMDAKIMQAKGYRQEDIAHILCVSVRTVRNYQKAELIPRKRKKRSSKLDPYRDYIKSVIHVDPFCNIEVLHKNLVDRGYTGRLIILREYAAAVRKDELTEAVIRFETVPGEQAQVDWKEFGKHIIDGREQKLYAFVMLPGYSRKPYVQFTSDMKSDTLRMCHIDAFHCFGGVPRTILYDNMKTAFVADSEQQYRPNVQLMELAVHYGFIFRKS